MKRRCTLFCLLALALLWSHPASAAPEAREVIYIQPLGKALPDADVHIVRESLTEFYGLPVRVLARVPLPRAAYRPKVKRWQADDLLDFLEERRPADGRSILGLTAADIATRKGRYAHWGILGLATLDGGACVISSFRCKRTARSRKHGRERLAKVAVHEIGHNLGLEHCPHRGCLMEDAKGTVKTCDREYDLCPACRARLKAQGRPITDTPKIPWSRPR